MFKNYLVNAECINKIIKCYANKANAFETALAIKIKQLLRFWYDDFNNKSHDFFGPCGELVAYEILPGQLQELSLHPYENKDDVNQRHLDESEHILWAAPKSRRSLERRRMRRIGLETYVCKLLPKKLLLTCNVCGHVHEKGLLCPNCYSKVAEVTNKIKEAMRNSDGLNPIEHGYTPVFEGEKVNSNDGYYQGKRVIEIPMERPSWFAKKLLQKSNVTLSSEKLPGKSNPFHIK